MKIPPRHPALVILILLACAAAAWGMGGREDPLVQADQLISEQKYDQAILLITDFMKNNPDRFDAAQKLLRKITRIRTSYNNAAVSLLDVLVNEPTNEEKKLRMIAELESFERNPNPAVKEFISRTKDLALFTYNRAKFEEIMAKGRELIDTRSFAQAARVYETGFVLYRPEFLDKGYDPAVVEDAFARVAVVSDYIARFEDESIALAEAFTALAASYAGSSSEAVDAAWDAANAAAINVAKTRLQVVNQGRALEAAFIEISKKDETVTENSFLPFAFRLVLGRKSEGRLEGITGSIDAAWTGALGTAQAAIDTMLETSYTAALDDFDRGSWQVADAGFSTVAGLADRGIELLSLWSLYLPSDLEARSTALGQAALELKGADYLRYVHASGAARLYIELTAVQAGIDNSGGILASYIPPTGNKTEALAGYESRRLEFAKAAEAVTSIRERSGTSATRMAAWTEKGYGSDWSKIGQGDLDGRIQRALDKARSQETRAVASSAAYEYGLLSAESEKAIAAIAEGGIMLAGLKSDDPLMPDAVFKYPGKALSALGSADSTLRALRAGLEAFLASYQSRPGYISADASVLEWTARARDLLAATGTKLSEAASLTTRATDQKRLADSSRLEAERRVAEARTALRANNFETARERLDRARERFLVSLSFEQDPLLRVSSDRTLSELASAILKAENDLVVADTRRLLTAGKNSYLQGEFDRAETSLLQARSRWAATNTTAEVEVEYWLKLVQTALSVKTGRDIPVTAPLFPEMSQLISLAKRYYEDGTSLLARRDKTGAVKSFTAARQKISEVKVIFPLNQEARVLELKIDQLSDPDEFSRKFARMFAEAKAKIDAKIDLTTAYSDLKDLEAINPRYAGLRTQIERAEILLGFRQPPPDPRAIAEARSLVQAAQRIFDSGQVSQFAFARTQLERAITLDPNNENASRLKDRIATYIGGDTAIVLPSAAETLYNEAVSFFTGGDYINARARLTRLVSLFAKGKSVQKVADLDSRLTAIGY